MIISCWFQLSYWSYLSEKKSQLCHHWRHIQGISSKKVYLQSPSAHSCSLFSKIKYCLLHGGKLIIKMLNECELALAQASENNAKSQYHGWPNPWRTTGCQIILPTAEIQQTCEAIIILNLMNRNTIYIADIASYIAAILLWRHS